MTNLMRVPVQLPPVGFTQSSTSGSQSSGAVSDVEQPVRVKETSRTEKTKRAFFMVLPSGVR